jgi:nicotinate-nucleotide--dimethylbenzimidazole phosphoribosyltransferase
VVDVGVDADLPSAPGLRAAKIRRGTADLAVEPALTPDEVAAGLDVGAAVAADLVGAGARALVTGDMGIGNTTPSAAVIAALTGQPAAAVTGRGTGIDDATLACKVAAVEAGLARLAQRPDAGPVDVLAEVGGHEIAALAGFVVGGAAARTPVVIDGVIALAGALAAVALAPDALGYCVAGHRSTEPGASVALTQLGLDPVVDLGLRLGEGTGACLALPVLEAAARVLGEMATFDTAGVTQKG